MWKPWENESETQRIRRQKERYRDDKRWQIIDERKNDPMGRLHTRHRKKLMICGACVFLAMLLLIGRLGYVMIFQAQYYLSRAEELHERERRRTRILLRFITVSASSKRSFTKFPLILRHRFPHYIKIRMGYGR